MMPNTNLTFKKELTKYFKTSTNFLFTQGTKSRFTVISVITNFLGPNSCKYWANMGKKQSGQCCLVISSSMTRNTDKRYIRYLFIVEVKVWLGPYSTFNKTNTMPVSNSSTIEKFTECRYTCDLRGYQ